LARSALAKFGASAISAAASLIVVKLIVGHYGVEAYAQYGLLVAIATALPFADLGMSAAVINAVSSSGNVRSDELVRRTLISALRVLIASAATITTIATIITAAGWWPTILGPGASYSEGTISQTMLTCISLFAVSVPLAIGQRVLVGLGQNHVQVWIQCLMNPIVAALLAIGIAIEVPGGGYAAVLAYSASGIVAAISLALAGYKLGAPASQAVLLAVFRVRAVRGVRVMNVGLPMLVQMVALPIALQSDRILLSHYATVSDLAAYMFAFQVFNLIIQLASSAGMALWPMFAKARRDGEVISPIKYSVVFGLGGVLGSGVIALLLPAASRFIADGLIVLDPVLITGFVLFVGLQAAKVPLGMYMTDARGLRYQAAPIVLMVPLNIGISVLLIETLGVAGPVLSGAVTVALCQVAPPILYVMKDLRKRRAELLPL
jgi:O-antigen/teichoic acid export membrane protein